MHFSTNGSSNHDSATNGHVSVEPFAHVKKILVTGAAGFIGGWFVRHMLRAYGDKYNIVGFDNLEYCASLENLRAIEHLENFQFVKGDICSIQEVELALQMYDVDAIVHLAAKTHVDDSFNDAFSFTKTNILGTQVLLEAARKKGSIKRFLYASTDEVYGENSPSNLVPFTEEHKLNPTNPYAASKAAAEMIVKGYQKPFQMPILIARCNNVFGPCQYPEKLIPKFITLLEKDRKMPIHGDGRNIRAFLFASDAAEALDIIFHRGTEGETYNISSTTQLEVLEVAEKILKIRDERHSPSDLVDCTELVKDRPFNDGMYWTSGSKLQALGWEQRTNFDDGLWETYQWYRAEPESFWSEEH